MAAPGILNIDSLIIHLTIVTISLISISAGIFDDVQETVLLKHIKLDPVMIGTDFDVRQPNDSDQKLVVFCYPGQEKKFYRMWINPKITIHLPKPDVEYDVYTGSNFTEVVSLFKAKGFMSWPSPFAFLKQEYSFPPFNSSCIGIASSHHYNVKFRVKNPELWFILYTVLGLLIFFSAPSSSRNMYLHYGTGVSLGVLGSFLIMVFVISKFLPQRLKTLGYAVGILSTSLSMFLMRHLTVYINYILLNNWQILLGYVCVSGLISFFVVYRYGPVNNPRTLDLIRWSMQLLGLTLIYHGTQIAETSIAIILMALFIYNFPRSLFLWIRKLRYRYFPQKIRFLSEEEYIEEKERVTKESLQELREYCRSPDCNAWRTISRLSSPNRLASFVEGDNDITEDELSTYSTSCTINPRFAEDDSSSSDDSDLSYVMEIIAKRHPD